VSPRTTTGLSPLGTTAVTAAAGAAVGLGALAWGVFVERNRFTVRHEVLPILEPGSRTLTILHLSDLHLAPWQSEKQEWVRGLAVLEPDLVVNTGDNIGHEDAHTALEYTLEPFRGVPGVFVNGSNDYYGPTPKNPFTYFGGPSKVHRAPVDLDVDRMQSFLPTSSAGSTSTTRPGPSNCGAPGSNCSASTTPTGDGTGSTASPEPSTTSARTWAGRTTTAGPTRSASGSPTPPTNAS